MRGIRILFLLIVLGVVCWAGYRYALPALGWQKEEPVDQTDKEAGLSLYQDANYDEALPYLEREVAKKDATPDVMLALGKSLSHLGRNKEARTHLDALAKTHPRSQEAEEAVYLMGEASTDAAARSAHWATLLGKYYDSPWAGKVALTLAEEYYAQEKLFDARGAYSRALIEDLSPEKEKEIKEILEKINAKLVFSKAPSPDSVIYKVKPGDSLDKIGKQYRTAAGLIALVNGLKGDPPKIYPEQQLKVITSKVRLLVEVEKFRLTVLLGRHWLKEYPVGVGREGEETPTGMFVVTDRQEDPPWHRRGEPAIPPHDPRNILGSRWLGLKSTTPPEKTGYGIHGTRPEMEDMIGTNVSAGCIRLKNSDVEDLFELVISGTVVEIR